MTPVSVYRMADMGVNKQADEIKSYCFPRLRCLTQFLSGYTAADYRQAEQRSFNKTRIHRVTPSLAHSSMSLRFSRSQSTLRSLSFQSSRRGVLSSALRTENLSRLGQTQFTCGHTRRFKSTYIDALKVTRDPTTQKPASVSDIEVRLGSPRLDDPR